MGTEAQPDHVRGLAVMCAVMTLVGVVALGVTNAPSRTVARSHRGSFIVAGDFRGSTGGPEVPSTLLPLFPSTTTTRLGATTSTQSISGGPVDTRLSLPALGSYAYSVDGSESLTGFGTRKLPVTMHLGTGRTGAGELVIDAVFSDQHKEHAVVAFQRDALVLSRYAMTVVFGPVTRATDHTYAPGVAQLVLPFSAKTLRTGTSDARGANGVERTEDWKLTDVAVRSAMWEVAFERTSRPGADESVHETRAATFDPARRIWTKWETHLRTERTTPVKVAYQLDYTATYASFTPA